MKTRSWLPALLLFALAARADEGRADKATRFRAVLVGTEETPSIFTAGTGRFTARIVDNDTRIEFTLTYANLTAPPLVAEVTLGSVERLRLRSGVEVWASFKAVEVELLPP